MKIHAALAAAAFCLFPIHAAELWEEQDAPVGTLHEHTYKAASLERERPLLVYTPPGYEKSSISYPLLVLAHGRGENQRAWIDKGHANLIYENLTAAGKVVPAVILMIDGHQLPNAGRGQHAEAMVAFRRELLEDAIPFLEKNYRVLPGAENRAIAGLSMGGRQSLETALSRPDLFSWVGSFSGAHSPDAAHYQPYLSDVPLLNRSFQLIWMGCGKQDAVLSRNQPHVELFKQSGLNIEWHLTDGEHTWDVWQRYLSEFAPRLFVQK